MASNHTPNYNLNQWQAADQVKRTEFNEDNAQIDAALQGLADGLTALEAKTLRMDMGSYIGNNGKVLTLNFPFPPKFLYIWRMYSKDEHFVMLGETYFTFCEWLNYPQGNTSANITRSGSTIQLETPLSGDVSSVPYKYAVNMNRQGDTYAYLAIG